MPASPSYPGSLVSSEPRVSSRVAAWNESRRITPHQSLRHPKANHSRISGPWFEFKVLVVKPGNPYLPQTLAHRTIIGPRFPLEPNGGRLTHLELASKINEKT